jgi:hypothetical protein
VKIQGFQKHFLIEVIAKSFVKYVMLIISKEILRRKEVPENMAEHFSNSGTTKRFLHLHNKL